MIVELDDATNPVKLKKSPIAMSSPSAPAEIVPVMEPLPSNVNRSGPLPLVMFSAEVNAMSASEPMRTMPALMALMIQSVGSVTVRMMVSFPSPRSKLKLESTVGESDPMVSLSSPPRRLSWTLVTVLLNE